jgi:carbonic anhydrase
MLLESHEKNQPRNCYKINILTKKCNDIYRKTWCKVNGIKKCNEIFGKTYELLQYKFHPSGKNGIEKYSRIMSKHS